MKRLQQLLWLAGLALVGAAVYQELQKPPAERTWRGTLFGTVPYDFTMPTVERLQEAYWNPNSSSILTDRVFGVGWGVNFHALLRWLQGQVARPAD